jgi:hypothetical protein
MKIAIVGAGWYGCHIGLSLKNNGYDIKIFEKNTDIFLESSTNNQYRLHQGLHYARSSLTRYQSRDGFLRFCERYPNFSQIVDENYYLIPKYESILDFDTYFSIMFSSGINIEKLNCSQIPSYLDSTKFEGLIKCEERILLNNKAKQFFTSRLNNFLYTSTKISSYYEEENKIIINGEVFDYLIDSTWGSLTPITDCFYEPTLLLYYHAVDNIKYPAITLVDGPLWSIYPTETSGLYTLSSVTHTPLGVCKSKDEAYHRLSTVTTNEVAEKRSRMEQEVIDYFPNFLSCFNYHSPQFSMKTKPIGKADNRHSSVIRKGRVFTVCSGKVDNIFQASDFILGQISEESEEQ